MQNKTAKSLKAGTRVKINPRLHWYCCPWFPRGEVTGIAESVTTRNGINVAVDQLPEPTHQHGRRTLQFIPSEVTIIEG